MNQFVASEYTYIEKSCFVILVTKVAYSMVKVKLQTDNQPPTHHQYENYTRCVTGMLLTLVFHLENVEHIFKMNEKYIDRLKY